MEILDILILTAVLVVLALVGMRLFAKKKPARTPEERMGGMLAKIAGEMHGRMEDGTIELERNGLKMRYSFRVSAAEEKSTVHHSFSAETGNELDRYYITRPASPKRQAEIYPKTELSAYIPSKIRRLLETDEDANYFMDDGYGVSVSVGGKCVSPQLGLYMGRKDLVMLDASTELSKGNMFYPLLSGRLKEDEEGEFGDDWKDLVARGFSIMEKVAKIAREE